ncbi:MAG: SRPBCC family protein [Chloroflexota bacterium]
MTRIEADALIEAPPSAVWQVLIDHERWPEWCRSPEGTVRLDRVELLAGSPDGVGAVRRCTATLTAAPFVGTRDVTWTERIADVRYPWTLEFELAEGQYPLRRARSRLSLVEGRHGETRVRWRITYWPSTIPLYLADYLFLRRAIAGCLQGALANLVALFEEATPAPAEEVAAGPLAA